MRSIIRYVLKTINTDKLFNNFSNLFFDGIILSNNLIYY